MTSKMPRQGWNALKDADVHAPEGVEELRSSVRYGLRKYYGGIACSMFRYDRIDEEEQFRDMLQMSRDTVPEKYYYRNGECCLFKFGDQLHILPYAFIGGLNLYGYPVQWHPVPVGWNSNDPSKNSDIMNQIYNLKLDSSNSVILRNDLFGQSDLAYIDAMIDELVDNVLTVNQLQLLASSPYVFNTTEDNLLSAKQYFLSLARRLPVIFKNSLGDKVEPVIEKTDVKIDPAVFEIYDRWECMLLEHLGFPCVPITKRAQQTVSEVQSNDDKIRMKRLEKLNQRRRDWKRVNEMFGTNIEVISVIDEWTEESQQAAEEKEVRTDER